MNGLRPSSSLWRRGASLVYELILLVALLFVASFPFAGLSLDKSGGVARLLYQGYLLAVVGGYFVWFWRHGGQTLAMKTWQIRLVSATTGGGVNLGQAWYRYLLAVLGTAALGVGFLWGFVDPERQFLHDRLAKTRLVDARKEV